MCSVIIDGSSAKMFDDDDLLFDSEMSQSHLDAPFSLPQQFRESIISTAISILSNKEYLRACSRTKLYVDDQNIKQEHSIRLVIHWESLLVLLLRTVPYLDESKCSKPLTSSSGSYNQIVKNTAKLIKASRRYFETDAEWKIWNMFEADLLTKSHSVACFRAQAMLYLFLPSQCSVKFYDKVLPLWLE